MTINLAYKEVKKKIYEVLYGEEKDERMDPD